MDNAPAWIALAVALLTAVITFLRTLQVERRVEVLLTAGANLERDTIARLGEVESGLAGLESAASQRRGRVEAPDDTL